MGARVEIVEARNDVIAWGQIVQLLQARDLSAVRAEKCLQAALNRLETLLAADDPSVPAATVSRVG